MLLVLFVFLTLCQSRKFSQPRLRSICSIALVYWGRNSLLQAASILLGSRVAAGDFDFAIQAVGSSGPNIYSFFPQFSLIISREFSYIQDSPANNLLKFLFSIVITFEKISFEASADSLNKKLFPLFV